MATFNKLRDSSPTFRSVTPGRPSRVRSESPSNQSDRIFLEFLTEVQNSQGRLSTDLIERSLLIGRSLTEQFTKSPGFPIEFYLAMTSLLNYLQEEDLEYSVLLRKASEAMKFLNNSKKEEQVLRSFTDKVNLKVINTLRRIICNHDGLVLLFNAFIILFNQADKEIEKIPLKKMQNVKVIEIMQKYLQTPGRMIQLCRKFSEFVENQVISEGFVGFADEILKNVSKNELLLVDRTSGVLIFYDFVKACIDFFYSSRQNMSKISLIKSGSQENIEPPGISTKTSSKLIQLDEAVEISKELLKQSSRTLTPVKSNHSQMLVSYFQARFQKFLCDQGSKRTPNYDERVLLYDQFERMVINEVRDRFIPRVVNLQTFEEELSNL